MHNLIWLGATALFVSLFAVDGVRAELESNGARRVGDQIVTCRADRAKVPRISGMRGKPACGARLCVSRGISFRTPPGRASLPLLYSFALAAVVAPSRFSIEPLPGFSRASMRIRADTLLVWLE